MICGYCGIANSISPSNATYVGRDRNHFYACFSLQCAECGGGTFSLFECAPFDVTNRLSRTLAIAGAPWVQIHPQPKPTSRPAPPEVEATAASDFSESCAVLSISPKASAALSRRCLQYVLRAQGFAQHNLAEQIDAAIAAPGLSAACKEAIDAVRVVGNFAAHPTKDTNTGEIVEVEPGEAEWLLDTLELLFDHYYVQPELLKKKRETLNAKLTALGKPPLKG